MKRKQKLLIVAFASDLDRFLNYGWGVVFITTRTDNKLAVLVEKL